MTSAAELAAFETGAAREVADDDAARLEVSGPKVGCPGCTGAEVLDNAEVATVWLVEGCIIGVVSPGTVWPGTVWTGADCSGPGTDCPGTD